MKKIMFSLLGLILFYLTILVVINTPQIFTIISVINNQMLSELHIIVYVLLLLAMYLEGVLMMLGILYIAVPLWSLDCFWIVFTGKRFLGNHIFKEKNLSFTDKEIKQFPSQDLERLCALLSKFGDMCTPGKSDIWVDHHDEHIHIHYVADELVVEGAVEVKRFREDSDEVLDILKRNAKKQ